MGEDKELSMCISEGHKTTANILARKAFTVSMATAEQAVACDYVGIESGNKVAEKTERSIRTSCGPSPLTPSTTHTVCWVRRWPLRSKTALS